MTAALRTVEWGRIAVLILIVVICFVLFLWVLVSSHQYPWPMKFLQNNRIEITQYLEKIEAGTISAVHDTHEYPLCDVLVNGGITHVRMDDAGCIHFMFASLPPDATEELIYCPIGIQQQLRSTHERKTVVAIRYIDDNWIYRIVD